MVRGSGDTEELRVVPPHGGLSVPGASQGNLTRVEKTHARESVLQLQRGRRQALRGVGEAHRGGFPAIQGREAASLTPMNRQSLAQRGILIAVAAAAYLVGFWPSWWVRDLVLSALNNPPYEGPWILIPHLVLYTTL